MVLKRIFKILFQTTRKSGAAIFEEARKKGPGKTDYDCLKFVLLSKPPFDFQEDRVIENILKEFKSIKTLDEFISDVQKDETLWAMRNRNLKRKSNELTIRNTEFFNSF